MKDHYTRAIEQSRTDAAHQSKNDRQFEESQIRHFEANGYKLRASRVCALCKELKSVGPVVCWACWAQYKEGRHFAGEHGDTFDQIKREVERMPLAQ